MRTATYSARADRVHFCGDGGRGPKTLLEKKGWEVAEHCLFYYGAFLGVIASVDEVRDAAGLIVKLRFSVENPLEEEEAANGPFLSANVVTSEPLTEKTLREAIENVANQWN